MPSSDSCARLRSLHSFPTRRSSDLHSIENLAVKIGWRLSGLLGTERWRPAVQLYAIAHGMAKAVECRHAVRPFDLVHSAEYLGVGSDRKSTRLNSSHGYISYAVF